MKKINIKTQIRLGIFVVFVIMLLSSLFLIFQIQKIKQKTKLLYEHPLRVSNTIRDIKTEIYKTARLVRDIRYPKDDNEFKNLITEINKGDSLIYSDLQIVYDLYLGNKKEIDSLKNAYIDWEKMKNVVYILKKANKIDSLDSFINQENRFQVDSIIYHANKIAKFAYNKAEQTYSIILKAENLSFFISLIFLILASIAALFFIVYIPKSITKPINAFVNDASSILSKHSEKIALKDYNEKDLFGLTLDELKQSYINIELQNQEIKKINEQLLNNNISLEEKVKQRTIELQKSEEKYRLISENAEEWIYLIAPDETLQYTSPSFERMTGYSLHELYSNLQFIENIIYEEDKTIFKNHHVNLKNEKDDIEGIEFRIVNKSGEILWINHTCAPIYNQNGAYVGRRETNRNITTRKMAEEKIRIQLMELERWYKVMLGREERNRQLKKEVNELLLRLGEKIRYASQEDNTDNK